MAEAEAEPLIQFQTSVPGGISRSGISKERQTEAGILGENRTLSAILFSDVVGYTKMMDADEMRALELIEKQMEIVSPVVD